ncbi:MAG: aminoacetone oxidase family FAD-binding enzyme [Verrucomicrobia bacterium]|nr:aminoacetone oxidase family FAD-binding enzyme [Verrucomicrobiota bacterium]
MPSTDLIIIGGGAAGLMAGVTAGELGLRAVILESRPKPGRKLLMCGNNRCNITSAIPPSQMLADFGEPIAPFLKPALTAFPPDALRAWCHKNGLLTKMQRDKRVYPHSEKAADVHHLFTDLLATYGIGLMLNSSAREIIPQPSGELLVKTDNLELSATCVLIATGGVSYPKTGSVGDGQKMVSALGHKVTPYRPGLAGFDMPPAWIAANPMRSIPNVKLKIMVGGKAVATTEGFLEIEKYGIGGPAVTNASRIIARRDLKNYSFEVDVDGKKWTLNPVRVRPLKEAMVTVGGIELSEINPRTMESKCVPGLFLAGEVLDIDGPSGGYNLQAAFSTARLAVEAIAKQCPTRKKPVHKNPSQKKSAQNNRPQKGRPPREKRHYQNRKCP